MKLPIFTLVLWKKNHIWLALFWYTLLTFSRNLPYFKHKGYCPTKVKSSSKIQIFYFNGLKVAYSKTVSHGVISVSNKTVPLKRTTHFIKAYFPKYEIWECYLNFPFQLFQSYLIQKQLGSDCPNINVSIWEDISG